MAKVIQINGRVGKRARAKLRKASGSRKDPQQVYIAAMIQWVRKYRAGLAS